MTFFLEGAYHSIKIEAALKIVFIFYFKRYLN